MDRAGLVGADGPTHHGVFDISMLLMLPNIVITAPRDGDELKNLLYTSQFTECSLSIRYPKGSCKRYNIDGKPIKLKIGTWEKVNKGKQVAILAVGSMVEMIDDSLDYISNKIGFTPELINCRFIKPIDLKMLEELTQNFSYIITIEEGALIGGFGAFIQSHLTNSNIKVISMGIPDNYIQHGSRQELLDQLELNKDGIINIISTKCNV